LKFAARHLHFSTVANNALSKLRRMQAQAVAFLTEKDIGREDDARRHWLHRLAHFWLLVGKSFMRNRCPVRASALAYTTLLALIPLLAVGVSITTSLLQKEGEAPIREMIEKLVANVAPSLDLEARGADAAAANRRQEVVKKITDFIANIQSGTLGLTGTIALVFVAIGLLRTIEATFNDIWGITACRTWLSSIVQYWAAISLGPVILVLVIGLTTGPHFGKTAALIGHWPWVGALLFRLLPFVVLSLAFGLLYQLMPNTRVQWQAALIGGIVGGSLWQLNNILSVHYFSKAVTYSQIYGSLSLIPLFLVGMYTSWLILLFGAQVAYAYQNRQSYLQEKVAETVCQRGREFVALRLMTLIGRRFQTASKPDGVIPLAECLGVPSRIVSQILAALKQANLVVEVTTGGEGGFVPARPLERINANDVLQALRVGCGLEPETADDPARATVRERFEEIGRAERDVASALTIDDLAREAATPRPAIVPPA